MKPVMQTKFSNKEGTEHGNCLSACVASILEIPLSEVPLFEELGKEWGKAFFELFYKHGYDICINENEVDLLNPEKAKGIDGYVIVGGDSFREWVVNGHGCLYKNGKLAHDPHPSGQGIKKFREFWMIEKLKNKVII
jgi:hypothetical protein